VLQINIYIYIYIMWTNMPSTTSTRQLSNLGVIELDFI